MTGPRLSVIPARAATDRALKPRDLQVLCVLGRHTDDLGWCRRSQVRMADEIGCARSTVFEAIERLVAAGYLERHVMASDSGRDSAHVYRVILDQRHPDPGSIPPGDDDEAADQAGASGARREADPARDRGPAVIGRPAGAAASLPADQAGASGARREANDPPPPCRYVGTPAGISAPPAGPGPAPINDPSLTEERERARAATDDPRKFERRVKRLAEHCAWPGWAKSSTEWSVRQFAGLTDAERAEAERYGPVYVGHLGGKALSIGTYFAERKWRDLPAAVRDPPATPQVVEAKPFGPLWGAMVTAELALAAPQPAPPPTSGFIRALLAQDDAAGAAERLKRQARYGWPQVNSWFRQADSFRGFSVPASEPRTALAQLTEPVPVGSATFAAWRAEFERRGWPPLPDPGAMRVVYLPAGGPEALAAFEAAARRAATEEGDDGGERQAAE